MWAASLARSSGSAEFPGEEMQVRVMTDKTPSTRMARDYSTELASAGSGHILTNLSSCFPPRLSVESAAFGRIQRASDGVEAVHLANRGRGEAGETLQETVRTRAAPMIFFPYRSSGRSLP